MREKVETPMQKLYKILGSIATRTLLFLLFFRLVLWLVGVIARGQRKMGTPTV